MQIICNTDHKTWQIEIRDNGVGFSDEMRMELMQYKQKLMGEGIKNDAWREESKIGGMGMKNIITRLYLSYGCDMIFDIERQLGHGAVITVGADAMISVLVVEDEIPILRSICRQSEVC